MKKKENRFIFLQSISLGCNKLLNKAQKFLHKSLYISKRTAFNSVATSFK